jgi:FkbM family methyltransferase
LASSVAARLYLAEAIHVHEIEVVFDVGANVGQFALGLREMGYRGRILSFEPVEDAWRELSAHASDDDKWEVFNLAVGDVEGQAKLAVMRYNVFSSLHEPTLTQPYVEGGNVVTGYQTVRVRRLDALVDELSLRPLLKRAMLKCDVQGHDRHVIQGMSYIDELPLIQVELNVVPVYEGTPLLPEMLQFLDGLGFAPMLLSPVNRSKIGSGFEFDYLGVNSRLG